MLVEFETRVFNKPKPLDPELKLLIVRGQDIIVKELILAMDSLN